jgi:predicted DCC family thiol-disulfide oxidoreductase YuxK
MREQSAGTVDTGSAFGRGSNAVRAVTIAPSGPRLSTSAMPVEQPVDIDPHSPGGAASPHGLILFDGVCVLCSRGCRFVNRRDRRGYFRYVPIQEAEGRRIAAQLGIDPDHPDSFAFVVQGRASVKSEAALRIARELPWWGWTSALLLVPRPIRDAIYAMLARNRYRWFGRRDVCMLATADRRWSDI